MATAISPPAKSKVNARQRELLSRIDGLSYLPTSVAVAMKFLELGKDPDAGPADYVKVIEADASLTSKLLALANSSWAGVRNRVTTLKAAVNLLGLGTVRTLAISYCMTGLHNELQLSPAESQRFWEPSLTKATAARHYAMMENTKHGDEAFVIGLFEDFALPVIYSVLREDYLNLLRTPGLTLHDQLQKERELCGMDHSEIGRAVALKLELPELFVDTVAFHHNHERLTELVSDETLRDAAHIAALLPHSTNIWNQKDADALSGFLKARKPDLGFDSFLKEVQTEFVRLYSFFYEGKQPEAELPSLLAALAREAADNSSNIVRRMNELLSETVQQGLQAKQKMQDLHAKAIYDPLTQVLNREGFRTRAEQAMAMASRHGAAMALCYLDLDGFKSLNDRFGHDFGDAALQAVIGHTRAALPKDAILGRMGGDEFVVMLESPSLELAREIIERALRTVADNAVQLEAVSSRVAWSAGLLYVRALSPKTRLDSLLKAADEIMYQAKRQGGNRVVCKSI
ncbi:MAG TPA: HDOD domain-containing protein [Phycisphaerae bacterium]|nr:HDOD domain-containing protein [Phycisphaerae bacterium]